jgi:hypothetical protein
MLGVPEKHADGRTVDRIRVTMKDEDARIDKKRAMLLAQLSFA